MDNEQAMRCGKCRGATRVARAIDLVTGLFVWQHVCFSCGRRCNSEGAEEQPESVIAA